MRQRTLCRLGRGRPERRSRLLTLDRPYPGKWISELGLTKEWGDASRARSSVQVGNRLFNPVAFRGEDTLLLADLIERDALPLLAADAVVLHDVPLSVVQCFRKDIRSAYLEGRTYTLIASRGIRIRMSHRARLTMLRSVWIAARQPSIGKAAWLVLIVRQLLSRLTTLVYGALHRRSDLKPADTSLETRP